MKTSGWWREAVLWIVILALYFAIMAVIIDEKCSRAITRGEEEPAK